MTTIAWTSFTPWASLAGGIAIGIAVSLLLLFDGRIAGISGIVAGLLKPAAGDAAWRWAFVIGLVAAPCLYRTVTSLPPIRIDAGWGTLLAAGLLVGVGTRYGSGCTSGHGVCGLSRGSARSLVATSTFVATGFLTVFVIRHLLSA